MEKKNNGSKGGGVRGGESEIEFSSLPAVLLTESLGKDPFLPVSCEFPECMLPINGVPILNYIIEMMLKNGVTEIYLLTYSHRELLSEHIQEMKRSNKKLRNSVIQVIQLGVHCASVGDALRDLDCQADIRDDFLLIQGGLLCVADIRDVIQMHKKKRAQLPSLSMTIIFVESPPLSTLRTSSNEKIVIYDKETSELVHWDRFDDDLSGRLSVKRLLRNSSSTYFGLGGCTIRYDLLDIGMAVCSPQLLKTFCETFDFTDLFEDYVQNALSSDIKQDLISVSIMSNYAVRITDFRTYHVAQQHVCEGWAFPLVPDYCSISGQNIQRYQGMSVYIGEKVSISPSSEISSITTIGRNSRIGENCKIYDSFIGEDCVIGNNCVIRGCSILDGAEIGDNVEVDSSFISRLVKVGSNSKISSSCIIGSGISLREDSVIGPSSRISRYAPRSLLNKESTGGDSGSFSPSSGKRYLLLEEDDIEGLGEVGVSNGVAWPKETSQNQKHMTNKDILSSIVIFDSNLVNREHRERSRCSAFGNGKEVTKGFEDLREDTDSESGELEEVDSDMDEDSREFLQESRMLIKSGLENPAHMSNKILELKGLRFAFFKDDLDILETCVSLVLDLIDKDKEEFLRKENSQSQEMVIVDLEQFSAYCRRKGIIELISAFNRMEEESFTSLICSKLLSFVSRTSSELPFGSLLVTLEKLDLINQSLIPIWYDLTLKKELSEQNQDNSRALEILRSDFLVRYIDWIREEESGEESEG
ncbi:Translation initiation factor eIF-2B subunit epsilon [Cryptosporidium felis]|nr:Translation initiation factor eIF-2B subunit epsilon [Cryptosporidium felis]